mgnify:FL=1
MTKTSTQYLAQESLGCRTKNQSVALIAVAKTVLKKIKKAVDFFKRNGILYLMNKLDVIYLVASIASLTASVLLWFGGSKEAGIYVGLWVPSILGFWNVHKVISKD